MTVRKYSSRSQQTTLSAALSSSATTATVVSGSSLLGGVTISAGQVFTVVIDPDTAIEEIVDVTAVATNTLTIIRGVDGSTAQPHSAGAVVRHMIIGRDLREANDHIENTTTAHGVTLANLVKTTDTGTVTSTMIANNTIVNADINTSAQIAYGKLTLTNSIVDGDINASAAIDKTKISGTAVTQADTGTVTSTMIANGTIVDADINSSAAIALSKLATNPLARANHTGTQTASTISDFDTQVRTSRLDQMAAPTASVSLNSQKITNLTDPTSNQDAATKAYADTKIASSEKGANNGVATLGSDGKLTTSQIPDVTITDTFVVASQAAMLALTAQVGDVAVRTDLNKSFILKTAGASTLANWQELLTPTDAVLSVDGQTGTVSLSGTYATIASDNAKLPLAGGTMTGAIAMSSNKITGLGTPTNSGDAVTKSYADTKLALTGGTLSGVLDMGNNKITGLADPTAFTDAVTLNYFNNVALAPSNLTGPITSVGNATSIASQTGTGTKFVVDQSPTIVTPTLSGNTTAGTINNTTIPSSKTLVATDSTAYVVPPQLGNSGKYLTTDGTTSSWADVPTPDVTATNTVTLTNKTISGSNNTITNVSLTTGVIGTLPIANGGTGQTTATAALNALLPSQTGNNGEFLTTDGTNVSWTAIAVDTTAIEINSVMGVY